VPQISRSEASSELNSEPEPRPEQAAQHVVVPLREEEPIELSVVMPCLNEAETIPHLPVGILDAGHLPFEADEPLSYDPLAGVRV